MTCWMWVFSDGGRNLILSSGLAHYIFAPWVGGVVIQRWVCWFGVEWMLKFLKCLVYIVWHGYCGVLVPIIPIYFQSQEFFSRPIHSDDGFFCSASIRWCSWWFPNYLVLKFSTNSLKLIGQALCTHKSSSSSMIAGIIYGRVWQRFRSCAWTFRIASLRVMDSLLSVFPSVLSRCCRYLGEFRILSTLITLGSVVSCFVAGDIYVMCDIVWVCVYLFSFFSPCGGRCPQGSWVRRWCCYCPSKFVGCWIPCLMLWWVIWLKLLLPCFVQFFVCFHFAGRIWMFLQTDQHLFLWYVFCDTCSVLVLCQGTIRMLHGGSMSSWCLVFYVKISLWLVVKLVSCCSRRLHLGFPLPIAVGWYVIELRS